MRHLHLSFSHTTAVGKPASPSAPRRRDGASWLVSPSVAALLLWMSIPLAMTIWFSFSRYNLLNPDVKGFAGFDNYHFLATDPSFGPAIWHTLALIGAVLVITVVGGVLTAVLFDRKFYGQGIARLLMIAPFFVMPTVSALIWKNMILHPVYGLVASAMRAVGLTPIDWFADYPLTAVVIIVAWQWLPFAFLILFTAIQSLDQEQKEAARIDGAGPIAMFFYITLPHLEARDRGRGDDGDDLPAVDLRGDLHDHGRWPRQRDDQPVVSDLCARPAAVRRRARLGGRDPGCRGREHRVVLPGADAREEPERGVPAMSDGMLDMRRAGGPPNVFGAVRRALPGVLAWLIALALFFPIFWMAITAFKTEQQAYEASLFFVPTLDSFREVFARSNYFAFAWNSVLISAGVTVICLALAVPAAYAMAFFPNRRTQKVLLWMLSTKMMPSVGVLVPIYLLWKNAGLLDTVSGLVIVYALINLPIAVWMAFTYFNEIPKDILESGRIDGASTWQEIVYLLMPMALPGLASTALLLVILSWNEAFWSINLSSSNAAPLTVFIASYSSPEGLFWAKLSAASLLAVAPILVVGWLSQKQLVRGLTFGAVK